MYNDSAFDFQCVPQDILVEIAQRYAGIQIMEDIVKKGVIARKNSVILLEVVSDKKV